MIVRWPPRAFVLVGAAVLGFASPALAEPPTVDTCIDLHTRTQRSALEGRLREARALALSCAVDACPDEIRGECAGFATSYEPRIPSVVFRVRRGHDDVTEARVVAGEETLAARLDGRAVAVDPGLLRVAVVLPDGATREATLLVNEGEKSKPFDIAFAEPESRSRVAPPASSPALSRPVPVTFYVFGATAVASAVGFAVLGAVGNAGKADLDEQRCRPFCAQDDVDAIKRAYIAADVMLGVSVLSAGAAVVFLLTRPEVPAEPAVSLRIAPTTAGAVTTASIVF